MPEQATELQDMMMNQGWNMLNQNVSKETANKIAKQNKETVVAPKDAKIPYWTDIPATK